jgi:hypothetical protein
LIYSNLSIDGYIVGKGVQEVPQIATEIRNTGAFIYADNRVNKIRSWLAPPDPSTKLEDARKLHRQGTGQWFLDSSAYATWKRKSQSFLWLNGIPSCGKTIPSSTIITDLERNKTASTALYFFFD